MNYRKWVFRVWAWTAILLAAGFAVYGPDSTPAGPRVVASMMWIAFAMVLMELARRHGEAPGLDFRRGNISLATYYHSFPYKTQLWIAFALGSLVALTLLQRNWGNLMLEAVAAAGGAMAWRGKGAPVAEMKSAASNATTAGMPM